MSIQFRPGRSETSFAEITMVQMRSFTALICGKLAVEFYARGSYEVAEALEVAARLASV